MEKWLGDEKSFLNSTFHICGKNWANFYCAYQEIVDNFENGISVDWKAGSKNIRREFYVFPTSSPSMYLPHSHENTFRSFPHLSPTYSHMSFQNWHPCWKVLTTNKGKRYIRLRFNFEL